jgi:hypothetical protein
VFAAGVGANAGQNLLIVAVHQAHTPFGVGFDNRKNIVRLNATVAVGLLPSIGSVVSVFVALQPDLRFWKQIGAVGMIPVHVADDHIGDVFRLQVELADRL